MTTTQQARDLQPGDCVTDEDGRTLTVRDVTRGVIRSHVSINYTNGEWTEVFPDTLVNITRPESTNE